jgi:hypothetical protein
MSIRRRSITGIAAISAGELEGSDAVLALICSPPHIHPWAPTSGIKEVLGTSLAFSRLSATSYGEQIGCGFTFSRAGRSTVPIRDH